MPNLTFTQVNTLSIFLQSLPKTYESALLINFNEAMLPTLNIARRTILVSFNGRDRVRGKIKNGCVLPVYSVSEFPSGPFDFCAINFPITRFSAGFLLSFVHKVLTLNAQVLFIGEKVQDVRYDVRSIFFLGESPVYSGRSKHAF